MNSRPKCCFPVILLAFFAFVNLAFSDEPKERESGTGELTRPLVDEITMLGIREDGSRYAVSQPRLLLETFDPERGSLGDREQSGAIWAWGSGRPVAITVFWRWGSPGSWGHSFISTSVGKVMATYDNQTWTPEQSGLRFSVLEEAPAPGDTMDDRTPQMMQLANRFSGYEMVRRRVVELRMLPRFLHRYQTDGIDGAIFAIGQNDSPYAFLFLEAVSDPIEPSYWRYAWAKGTSSPVTVELNRRELLHIPGSINFLGSSSEPFWVFFRRFPTEQPIRSAEPLSGTPAPREIAESLTTPQATDGALEGQLEPELDSEGVGEN